MTDVRGGLPRRYTPFRRIMSPTVPPRSPIPATRVALACLLWLAGAASPAAGAEEQRIGRGDILRIHISDLQGPDTETTDLYRVDEDGCVELPRIGRTDIADLSESEAVDFILDKCRGDGFGDLDLFFTLLRCNEIPQHLGR